MFCRIYFQQMLYLVFFHFARIVVGTIFFQQGYFSTQGISQPAGHLMSSPDVVVCIVLTTLGKCRMFSRLVPHVKFLGTFYTQRLLEFGSNLIGIDEMAVHALSNVARSYSVQSVGVNQRVAFHLFGGILESGVAQCLVVIVLGCLDRKSVV